MKAIRKLLDTKLKLVIAILVLAILVTWLVLFFFVARDVAIGLVAPLLWTFLVVAVSWLAIHFGLKAWRKRKRSEFDQAVAAKEGIEDRRREWATWTAELEKQGIDRYELPFYLLVGEPQSGKSVLLHNSDLHFPFGQNRLSGVGGTRGCDWWFTEEAVVLDLAGRLFTHEGGATDRLEFEAFLQLLYEFRPLCPANGVILVIPCDSLLKDDAEQCGAKATKIQNALLSLTTQLQAQLPVYLVLTKGDQIFGFAESVHRLDVEHRHQMFGWSRAAEKIDAPFDVAEALQGFEELVRRARLLRAHMSAGARLPEALPEVDRMYAFPHELAGMQPNLEVYLKRIFTASNITDRVFFRGLYLTSGLQSGVPIAKVCTELFGKVGEADLRDLQALFSKPRAYFIKDLVRNRVFGERGLVRPTQGRVQQTRRTSVVGYGLAGLVLFTSVIWSAVYLVSGVTDEEQKVRDDALAAAGFVLKNEELPVHELLRRLQQIQDAIEQEPDALEKTFDNPRKESLQELYRQLFDRRLVPLVCDLALDAIDEKLAPDPAQGAFLDHEDLVRTCAGLSAFSQGVDFSRSATREALLECLADRKLSSLQQTHAGGDPLTLERAFELRGSHGGDEGLLVPWSDLDGRRIIDLAVQAVAAVEHCLEPGARTAPRKELGYMVAWYGAEQARKELLADRLTETGRAIEPSIAFAEAMRTLQSIEEVDLGSSKTVEAKSVLLGAKRLSGLREGMVAFLEEHDRPRAPTAPWSKADNWTYWATGTMNSRGEADRALNDWGVVWGNDDLGQTLYQQNDALFLAITAKIILGEHADPLTELDKGMRAPCERSLPRSLKNGGLAGLGRHIRDLDTGLLEKEPVTSPIFAVFLAQCCEAADLFASELATGDELVRAVGVDPSAAQKALCVPLVVELASLDRTLADLVKLRELQGTTKERLLVWRRNIERALFEHIPSRGPVKDWIPPVPVEGSFSDDAWEMLEALGDAATLTLAAPDRYRVDVEAKKAQRGVFFALARALEERWKARPVEQIGETAKTVDELSLLAAQVETRLGQRSALAEGGDLGQWSGRVDLILSQRLDHIAGLAEGIWRPESAQGPLSDALASWWDQLHDIGAMIARSDEEGLQGIGPIVDALQKGGNVSKLLPKLSLTEESLAKLSAFAIPDSESEVTGDSEYRALVKAIEEVQKKGSGEEGFGKYLAGKYAKELAGAPASGDGAGANAGIQLVRSIRGELGGRFRQEIQRAYLADLESLLESSQYSDFFELLFWDPTEEARQVDDKEVVEDLSDLLDPGGALADLGEAYWLFAKKPEDPAIELAIFPAEPPADEDEWAAVHRFLVRLRKFLLTDKARKIKEAKITFHLEPLVEVSGSVWDHDGIPQAEKRAQFYYPGDDSSDALESAFVRDGMGTQTVRGWGFSGRNADRRLRLIWSFQTDGESAMRDQEGYFFEVPSSLAPLLLAWSGTPESEDEPLEFRVEFVPRNTSRPAPLVLEFEQPLPLRPARP